MKNLKVVRAVVASLAILFLSAAPAFGQQPPPKDLPQSISFSGSGVAAGLGMGLALIGAGLGLGRIGAAALDSMARQPEVAPRVQTAMIIIAAMLEGATLAAVALSFVVGLNSRF